jgi:hypothetical protein
MRESCSHARSIKARTSLVKARTSTLKASHLLGLAQHRSFMRCLRSWATSRESSLKGLHVPSDRCIKVADAASGRTIKEG